MSTNKGLVIKNHYDLAQPIQMINMSRVLKQHIISQNLYTNIAGKNYAHVEGWQFAGGLLGSLPRMVAVENLSSGSEFKWRAEVEIVDLKTDKIISRGFAICSNKENKKRTFDEYAVLSMAQTRAIGKAYRNVVGWIMKLAGYEATPSEEMAKMGETPVTPPKPPINPVKPTPTQAKNFECHNCARIISPAENEYSKKLFKKPLCRGCQKTIKRK